MADRCVTCGRTEADRALSFDMGLELGGGYGVRPCCGKSQKQKDFEYEMDMELLGRPRSEIQGAANH